MRCKSLNTKIFLFGIDNAGKTAFIKSVKEGTAVANTRPSISFSIDNLVIDDVSFVVWDAPGQIYFRKLWPKGYNKAQILLFILDTADQARFDEALTEFTRVLKQPETRGIPLIFCFNKIDLDQARANKGEAAIKFQLESITGRKMLIKETSIYDNDKIQAIKQSIVDLVIGK